MTEQNTDNITDRPVADRTLAIRQAIKAGDRGLELQTMDDYARFAMKVAASQFCPPGFSEVDCFIALEKGAEVGLTPMQSLESIYVVNSRATLFGDAIKGLCEASGLMVDYDQVEIGTYPNDDYGWEVLSQRRGRKPLKTRFTIDDAKIAKLWGKTGKEGKPTPWITAPKRMLLMRARGFNLRDNFTDVLKGLQIGELVDPEAQAGFEHAKAVVGRLFEPRFEQQPAQEPTPTEPKRRGRPPKQAVETPAESPAPPPEAPEPAPSPNIPAQPQSPPESRSTQPQETLFGSDEPAAEIISRLKAAMIPQEKFIELMVGLGFIDAEVEDIRAGYFGIEKCDSDSLNLALKDWASVIKKLGGAANA